MAATTLPLFAVPVGAQTANYTIGPQYNGFWEKISNAGELAASDFFNGGSSGTPRGELDFKYGDDLNGFGRENYDVSGTLSPQTWPQVWGVAFSSDRKFLIQHNNFNNPIDDQHQTGGSIFDEATQTFTRLDPGFRSSWFMDRSESGYVVGYRDKTGLGNGVGNFNFYGVTGVAIAVSPSGAVTEVPHPEGTYGFSRQEEFPFDIIYDNEAVLTGVNESGLACGTGWKEGPDVSFNYEPERISFTYNISTGATTIIPDPFFGFNSISGASDINDHGEVVGASSINGFGMCFWIYLPAAKYGLSAGTHFIYEPSSSDYSWGSQKDWRGRFLRRDAKINNRGQVIFPVWFANGDTVSKKIWDAGTLRDVSTLNPDSSLEITSIIDINEAGQLLVGVDGFQNRILSPSPVSLTIDPDRDYYNVDETIVVKLEVDHFATEPSTYEFAMGPFEFDPEFFAYPLAEELEEGESPPDPILDPIAPFVLNADDEPFEFSLPLKALKAGVTEITTEATITDNAGQTTTLPIRLPVLIDPIDVTISVHVENYALNQIPEDDWGDRAKAVAAKRRADVDNGVAENFFFEDGSIARPFRNLLELEIKLKNVTNRTIDRLTIPGIEDSILRLIKNVEQGEFSVPVFPLKFYSHNNMNDDVSDGTVDITIPEVTLAPDGEVTFAWVMEAYDANPDPLIDDTQNLAFEPLILGRIVAQNGDPEVDLRVLEEQKINIIDKPLVKWGIQPKDGRTTYRSGQVVRVDGFLENVSTKDGGVPKDILVMMYPTQDGNLGGGFPKKQELPDTDFPKYYEIFELPAEGPGKRIDIDSIFISFPSAKDTSGTARYGIRVWIVEDDDTITPADGQSVIDENWSDEFEVTLTKNEPLLSAADQRRRECIALGIWPFICGFEEGTIDFSQGMYGLGKFLISTAEGGANLYRGLIAYEMLAMKSLYDAAKGDPNAFDELFRDSYDKYVQLVELGVMAGEAGSQIPMVFEAFAIQGGDAMSSFFDAAFEGDMEEVEFQIGQFLGANPDLLVEPLVVGMSYARLAQAARVA
ncbi:MAG: hypothetical protein AAGJ79_08960, partial [Verrucomicrobiota bacterium]